MIVFKKVIMKNFYSVGNKAVEIDLDKHKITIVSGKNGSGKCLRKSSILEIEADEETMQLLLELINNE